MDKPKTESPFQTWMRMIPVTTTFRAEKNKRGLTRLHVIRDGDIVATCVQEPNESLAEFYCYCLIGLKEDYPEFESYYKTKVEPHLNSLS